MIKYMLKCKKEHEFEAWFSKSTDYEEQKKRGLVICPECGTKRVEKAPMAPNVKRSKDTNMDKLAARIRDDIAKNCDDVGNKFADEARAMHYGEKPGRGIYGQASPREAKDLLDEGVEVVPLPDALTPRSKKKLN